MKAPMKCSTRGRRSAIALLIVLGGLSACGSKRNLEHKGSLEVEITPLDYSSTNDKQAFASSDGILTVFYFDMGRDIGLVLRSNRSNRNPLLLVDVDQDGKVGTKTDLSYGIEPENENRCVSYLLGGPSSCEGPETQAKGVAVTDGEKIEVSWRIPKRELSQNDEGAHVVFQEYDTRETRSTYYPTEPFQRVSVLKFAKIPSMKLPEGEWPKRVSAPTPPIRSSPPKVPLLPKSETPYQPTLQPVATFSTEPQRIRAGEQSQLVWDVRNTDQVTIQPGPGDVASKGRMTVQPVATTKYVLTAINEAGSVEREAVVEVVIPVEIVKFGVSYKRVRLDQEFALEWDVKGASEVTIELVGKPSGSLASFGPTKRPPRGRVSIRAARDKFTRYGEYEFKLTANGEGGPKEEGAKVDVVRPLGEVQQ